MLGIWLSIYALVVLVMLLCASYVARQRCGFLLSNFTTPVWEIGRSCYAGEHSPYECGASCAHKICVKFSSLLVAVAVGVQGAAVSSRRCQQPLPGYTRC